jgi:hypothetical protein
LSAEATSIAARPADGAAGGCVALCANAVVGKASAMHIQIADVGGNCVAPKNRWTNGTSLKRRTNGTSGATTVATVLSQNFETVITVASFRGNVCDRSPVGLLGRANLLFLEATTPSGFLVPPAKRAQCATIAGQGALSARASRISKLAEYRREVDYHCRQRRTLDRP